MAQNKAALEAEAKEQNVRTFEHNGIEFKIDADVENWSVESMLAFEENKAVSVVRSLLGADQWAKYMATKPNTKDFGELAEKLFQTVGLSAGE